MGLAWNKGVLQNFGFPFITFAMVKVSVLQFGMLLEFAKTLQKKGHVAELGELPVMYTLHLSFVGSMWSTSC